MELEERAKSALPLLLLLAIASALGVGVAIVLATVAMLLAAPAYADEGRLVLERPAGLAEAERLFSECEELEDGRVRVVEAYYNPYGEALAGLYLHRLPQQAVIERLSYVVDADVRPAVLTLRQGAALLERIAEIGPGELFRVEVEYRVPRSRWPS
jgi:hypothetical protein